MNCSLYVRQSTEMRIRKYEKTTERDKFYQLRLKEEGTFGGEIDILLDADELKRLKEVLNNVDL